MTYPITFWDAVNDPQLLGSPELWPGQVAMFEWLDEQLRAGTQELILTCGRQSGKSEADVRLALWMAALRPDLDPVASRSSVLIIATDREQSRAILRRAIDRAEASPVISRMIESSTRDELRLANGCTLLALPTDAGSIRGRSYRALILDELAHVAEGTGTGGSVEEIVRAAIPGMVTFGDRAVRVLSSTPHGIDTFFGSRVAACEKSELPGAALFRITTAEANPNVSREFLEQARKDDPDSFAAEYEGQLIGSGGVLIDPEALEAAIAFERELDPSEGVGWVAAVDLGFTRDSTACVIVGHDPNDHHRLLVGAARRWAPPAKRDRPPTATARRQLQDRVVGEIRDLLQRYHVFQIATDGYEEGLLRETLAGVELERVTMTASARVQVFTQLRGLIQSGRLGLIRDEVLLDELGRLRTSTRGGSLTIPLPRNSKGHLDVAVACALGCWLADRHERPGEALPFTVDVSEFDRRLPGLSIFGSDRSRLPRTADAVRSYRF